MSARDYTRQVNFSNGLWFYFKLNIPGPSREKSYVVITTNATFSIAVYRNGFLFHGPTPAYTITQDYTGVDDEDYEINRFIGNYDISFVPNLTNQVDPYDIYTVECTLDFDTIFEWVGTTMEGERNFLYNFDESLIHPLQLNQ